MKNLSVSGAMCACVCLVLMSALPVSAMAASPLLSNLANIDANVPLDVTRTFGDDDGLLSQIIVGDSNVQIGGFGVWGKQLSAGNIKFAIFEAVFFQSESGATLTAGVPVYISDAIAQVAAIDQWFDSPALSLVLNANTTYYMGLISDQPFTFRYSAEAPALTQNGLTSGQAGIPGANGSMRSFAAPFMAESAGSGQVAIRIEAAHALIDNGDTTIDTASGLEWLDLTLTQGVFAQDVLAGFGGYIDAGWTFATVEQVCGLLGALGDDTTNCTTGAVGVQMVPANAETLVNLLGSTTAIGRGAYGMFDNIGGFPNYFGLACINDTASSCTGGGGSSWLTLSGWGSGYQTVGSFLVRPVSTTTLIDNGDTTIDTASGLEWLDLTLTQGLFAQDVLAGFGGYIDDGWTFATVEQVCGLLGALGDDTTNCTTGAVGVQMDSANAATLVNLLGSTTAIGRGAYGMFNNIGGFPNYFGLACINDTASSCTGGGDSSWLTLSGWGSGYQTVGSFLVRAVTEPAPTTLIDNGDFSENLLNWTSNQETHANANGEYESDVTWAGDAWLWNLSYPLALEKDVLYRMTFRARASTTRDIVAGWGMNQGPWMADVQTFSLDTEWRTYQISGMVTYDEVVNSRLIFDYGQQLGTVYIDDVVLEADRFVTADSEYEVGESTDDLGETIITSVHFDIASGYLTPQNGGGWIIDRAQANTVQGSYLLNSVDFKGMYVEDCVTGEWINVEDTVYAYTDFPLAINESSQQYFLNHFYPKTIPVFAPPLVYLDEQFMCDKPVNPAQFGLVTLPGTDLDGDGVLDVATIMTKGTGRFAYVVEHRN